MKINEGFKMKNIIVVIAAITLSFSAFAQRLDGSKWTLEQLTGISQMPLTMDNNKVNVELEFTAGQILGSDGCNNIFAGYTQKSQKLTIKAPVGSTRMACLGDELSKFSNAYQQALKNVNSFKVDKKTLSLFDKSKKILATYRAAD
jgi:heat shock protein HslJ